MKTILIVNLMGGMMNKSWVGLLLLVSPLAWADAANGAQGPGTVGNIIMLAGFLLIFYFMLIRPQAKRAKEHRALITNIAKDDEVITSCGLIGKVLKVTDQFVQITLCEGVEVTVQKQAISGLLPKGTLKSI
jgi:preprotein translocase subunit YajC